ncbi:MAG: tRNA (N6-isopentenyl adenosine(37)-C2)-methylthiotransferase MiaB, partial [Burkholderiales bacterium]|nr:tRNA (N6-isopentenyl adenosine(37)-C2)-methylthiotransferase MiaB [Burkholderiales bacterium]
MNEYDSGRIADLLSEKEGYQTVGSPEEADLVVFNTCSVREKAQEKVFSDLGRIREIKKQHPHIKIAVGGCVAS